jgi:hypothetical protein
VLPGLVTATTSLPGTDRAPQVAHICVPDLMADVLTGAIDPGGVFYDETDLDRVANAYAAVDERRAIKSLVRVGSL